ncbi:EamA family transporter [Vibrio sp. S4M6]|uniref:EamA family transporter n=1 Tax=Vibrio sinus TaxID=2946865 RepID=UPI00202A1780|nr:EamA family transporter [Vibrio sinus]MCL9782657.1 EamA family transporter [Vibrio sinus]
MNSEKIALLAITAIAPLVWGSSYIVASHWLPSDSPLFTALVRALPSGLLLVLATRVIPKGIWWGRIALLGLLNIGLFFYGLFFAAMHLPGGMAALVMSCQPLIVIFLSRLMLSTPIHKNHIIAAFVGLAGIGLLVLKSNASLDWQGVAIGLIGTTSMAFGLVLTKKWGRPNYMGVLAFTGWQLVFGGLILLPIALLVEGVPKSLSTTNLLGYSYLVLFGTIMCYLLWFRGLEKLAVTSVSFLGFMTSISACILGYVFLGETLNSMQMLGALGILLAITLSNRPVKTKRSSHDERLVGAAE